MVKRYGGKKYKKYHKSSSYINKMSMAVRPEEKQVVTTGATSFSSVAATWTEVDLCNVAEGTTGTARIGKKLSITSVEIRMMLVGGQTNVAADDNRNVIRMVLSLWSAGAGTTPLTTAGATLAQPITKDLNTRGGILRKYVDKFIALPVQGPDSTGYIPSMKMIKYYKRFKTPIVIEYGDDTQSYPSKRLMLAMISDSGVVPNPGIVTGYAMTHYIDQ